MIAIDTNLFVYAHNIDSTYHQQAVAFIEQMMNDYDEAGNLFVCVPAQVFTEFIHVITWQRLQNPLSLAQAKQIVQDYVDAGVVILPQHNEQIPIFLELLDQVTSRKIVFDVALAATLKNNDVTRLYTLNVADFERFEFLTVLNPFAA